MENEMITVREIACCLRIRWLTAYKLVNSGQIPHVKVGFCLIIPRFAFLNWLEQNSSDGDSFVLEKSL